MTDIMCVDQRHWALSQGQTLQRLKRMRIHYVLNHDEVVWVPPQALVDKDRECANNGGLF
jgi:hypothetical protein